MDKCPSCARPLAGDICPAHGYVGLGDKALPSPFFRGMVVIFSGAITEIPRGWSLCDGSNATPDLRDKFVMGAGTTAVGTAGGSNAHTHSVSVSGTTAGSGAATSGAGSSHSHSGGWVHSLGSTNTGYAGTHDHGAYTGDSGDCSSYGVAGGTGFNRASASHTHSIGHTHSNSLTSHAHDYDHAHGFTQAGAEASHTHYVSISTTGTCSASGSAPSGGVGVAYYTLAYIMYL